MPAGRLSHSARARVRPWPRQNEFLINALQCRQDRVAGGVGNGRGNSGAAGGLRIPIDFFFFLVLRQMHRFMQSSSNCCSCQCSLQICTLWFRVFPTFLSPPPYCDFIYQRRYWSAGGKWVSGCLLVWRASNPDI